MFTKGSESILKTNDPSYLRNCWLKGLKRSANETKELLTKLLLREGWSASNLNEDMFLLIERRKEKKFPHTYMKVCVFKGKLKQCWLGQMLYLCCLHTAGAEHVLNLASHQLYVFHFKFVVGFSEQSSHLTYRSGAPITLPSACIILEINYLFLKSRINYSREFCCLISVQPGWVECTSEVNSKQTSPHELPDHHW